MTAVLHDVDGETHVAVVLVDDPAADLHDWYGRYFYFAPDELEPVNRTRGERSMKVIGIVTLTVIARGDRWWRPWSGSDLVPDIQRYRKIRKM